MNTIDQAGVEELKKLVEGAPGKKLHLSVGKYPDGTRLRVFAVSEDGEIIPSMNFYAFVKEWPEPDRVSITREELHKAWKTVSARPPSHQTGKNSALAVLERTLFGGADAVEASDG